MAKIILSNGVINVEDTYEEVKKKESCGDWVELNENNVELRLMQKATGIPSDTRIYININHIQCIKP